MSKADEHLENMDSYFGRLGPHSGESTYVLGGILLTGFRAVVAAIQEADDE